MVDIDLDAATAVAARYRLPLKSVVALVTEPVEELRARHEYLPPSNTMDSPTIDYPRFELETPRMQSFISDPRDCYVDFLTELDARSLRTAEPENGIRRHPTYARYLDFARAGFEPPYIEVYEHFNDVGEQKLVAGNRRRTLVAQDLGMTIQGWLGLENRETGLPLKYGDVMEAYRLECESAARMRVSCDALKPKSKPSCSGMGM